MKIAIQPFFSQQNKITNKFLLDGCLTVRISLYLAKQLTDEGYDIEVFLPDSSQCEPWIGTTLPIRRRAMPLSNKMQRLDFNAAWFEKALQGVDLLLTCNELLPAKARHVFEGKIAILNNLFPMGGWEWMAALQQEAWKSADCVAFMSDFIRSQYNIGVVWPMVYNANKIQHSNIKDIDVLFVQRCSITNYTHHEEFLQVLPLLRGLNVVFADPTGYLEKLYPELNYAHAFGDKYYNLLSRTKVVVALMTGDIHGGTSTREAIVSGANPVLLKYPHYEDIVKDAQFPGFCTLTPFSIAAAIYRQIDRQPDEKLIATIAKESYQATWPIVLRDIQCLLSQ